MEKWDLYTKYREKTGMEHIGGERILDGFYHLVVNVWVCNHKGEYMMFKRAESCLAYPLMWGCVSCSVLKGEDSMSAAIRGVKEMLGVELLPEQGKRLFSKNYEDFGGIMANSILDVWKFEYDGNIIFDNTKVDEVIDCKWITLYEIKTLYEEGKIIQLLDYFFSAFELDEPDYSNVIGQIVSGTVDRPLGSVHPQYPKIKYPLNYGYIDGLYAGDGEEQDVYIFGTDEPLEYFEGKVIGVFHRFNDVEDKWIVSIGDGAYSNEKILGDIAFQEQFFYGKLYRN